MNGNHKTVVLSLASKQVWPQILAVLHERPEKLVLLHSEDDTESRLPAQHLKKFFERTELIAKGNVKLETIPANDFAGVEKALDEIAARHSQNLDEAQLNFTGGNKLMSNAAFQWANSRGVSSFYLERNHQVMRFQPTPEGELKTLPMEKVDGHLADGIDLLHLVRCQLGESEVEREGELLTLKSGADTARLKTMVENGNSVESFLEVTGEADNDKKAGDGLEYQTAAALLALGVKQVRRSLRLKAKGGAGVSVQKVHAELDLVFTWGGRLWIVDCKDKDPVENLADLVKGTPEIVGRIRKELAQSHNHVLKQDLVAIREMGGLMGRVVCVRKSEMPEEVVQYAKQQKIEVVLKKEMWARLDAQLQPDKKAGAADIASLAEAFGKK